MGNFLDLFKARPTIKAPIKTEVVLSPVEKLLRRVECYSDLDELEKLISSPDSMLYGLMMHTVKFTTIYSISRNIYFKYTGKDAYVGVNPNIFMVPLGHYLSVDSVNHRTCKEWMEDIMIILEHYASKDACNSVELMVVQDIKTLLNAIDEIGTN